MKKTGGNTSSRQEAQPEIEIHPLTPGRWDDFEKLFGPRGACGGCWCMLWRVERKDFEAGKTGGNRNAMRTLVRRGKAPGLLAYEGRQAVGWVAIAPRSDYPGLARSRLLKPLDDAPVWSVTCLFVARTHRHRGISTALIQAAAEYAKLQGGTLVEGYPQETKSKTKFIPDVFAWTGLATAFLKAGFVEAARPSPTRPIMRKAL